MALLSNGQLAKCPRCGMNMLMISVFGQYGYKCTWTFCDNVNQTHSEAYILSQPVLTQAQKDAYRLLRTAKMPPIYSYQPTQSRHTSMKVVRVTYLYNNTIVELHFITMPRKGWFKDNIQPVIDVMKNMIPANAREYDPATFKWQIAIEYWPSLRQILTSIQFAVKEVSPSTSHANVPKDYAENFYHAPVKREVETKESILVLLAKLLGIHEDIASMELVALKKKYREAARRYHPDLGGDAAKMAELNRVWSIYNTN